MSLFLFLLIAANGAAWFGALWRLSRLTRAVRHHEHVLRLTLETLSSPCPLPMPAQSFALMVLNEGAWDSRSRLLGSPLVEESPSSGHEPKETK